MVLQRVLFPCSVNWNVCERECVFIVASSVLENLEEVCCIIYILSGQLLFNGVHKSKLRTLKGNTSHIFNAF